MAEKHVLPVAFALKLWWAIKRAAKQSNTTPTEFIRQAVEEKTKAVLSEDE